MGALTETPKLLMIDSTRNDSTYYDLDENDAEEDPKRNPLVATHTSDRNKIKFTDTDTTNGNSPRKLLINRLVPEIIPVAILPIDQKIAEDAARSGETLHVRRTILKKDIVIDVLHSAAHVSGLLQT